MRRQPVRRLVRLAAVTADAGVLAVLGMGLAARSVRPDVWWVPQAAALALPAAVAVSVPLAAGWLLRLALADRRRSVAGWASVGIHVALAVAGLARILPGSASAPAGNGEPMRVLTLNAGHAGPSAGARMAQLLATEEPHVVVSQETGATWVQLPDSAGARPEILALPPVLGPVQPRYRSRPPEGSLLLALPVFTVGRPLRVSEHPLGASADEAAGEYSRTEWVWQGQRVAVYNVHLRSFGAARPWVPGQPRTAGAWRRAIASFREAVVERASEAERLRRALDAESLPYVLAGDLNSTPHQWAYVHLARGHTDALALHGQPFGSLTFPARFPLVRIDAILASNAWAVTDAWVGPGGLSDHRPVFATLRLHSHTGE